MCVFLRCHEPETLGVVLGKGGKQRAPRQCDESFLSQSPGAESRLHPQGKFFTIRCNKTRTGCYGCATQRWPTPRPSHFSVFLTVLKIPFISRSLVHPSPILMLWPGSLVLAAFPNTCPLRTASHLLTHTLHPIGFSRLPLLSLLLPFAI